MSTESSPATPVRVAILGATGRMGRSLLHAIHESPEFELVGASASPESPALGQDAGDVAGLNRRYGVTVTSDPLAAIGGADIALDFTTPGTVAAHVAAALACRCGLLVGTTGLDAPALAALREAAESIPVLIAPNTSLGVNLLMQLVEKAAASLPPEYDIEILEAHHRYKVDAPSGTALRLGEAAAAGRGETLAGLAVEARVGQTGPRRAGAIGFGVIRGGDIVGEHTVFYAGPGERLELTHRAHDRMTFAYGALRAAQWLRGRAAGRYAMTDVLGLG